MEELSLHLAHVEQDLGLEARHPGDANSAQLQGRVERTESAAPENDQVLAARVEAGGVPRHGMADAELDLH